MRRPGLLLLLFFFSFTCFCQYNIREIRIGDKSDPGFIFPVFIDEKSTAAAAISHFLQLSFFETTTGETSEAGLFDKSRYISNDSVLQTGYTSISYKVEANNQQILTVQFEVEGMGAYPTYFKRYFVFHSDSGQPLSSDTLFTPEGINEIKTILIERREMIIKEWINEIKKENELLFKEDSAFIVDSFKECNTSANGQNLFLGKDKFLFYKDDCFPHARGPYEASLDIFFTNKEFESYLSVFGKKVLFVNQQESK